MHHTTQTLVMHTTFTVTSTEMIFTNGKK
jgi:hypothetical protein